MIEFQTSVGIIVWFTGKNTVTAAVVDTKPTAPCLWDKQRGQHYIILHAEIYSARSYEEKIDRACIT